jgi:leucyl aminopeptidase
LDLSWGEAGAPRVTLVGKGVCFDSGGLDLKSAEGMALMKKDMGGAAVMLGLAGMIMEAGLDLRLRLLIPAVDNSVSAQSLRPGDVLQSRKGLSVEIGNTDAEGRLVLADAITEADAEAPELLLDAATLTGAARTALGPEIAALYCDDDELAADLARQAEAQSDPLWRLPLWAPYGRLIESRIADLNNAGEERMAGSITAALFLKRFVSQASAWAHLDLYAWNKRARPGRPIGGEAQTMRALFALIDERYGSG